MVRLKTKDLSFYETSTDTFFSQEDCKYGVVFNICSECLQTRHTQEGALCLSRTVQLLRTRLGRSETRRPPRQPIWKIPSLTTRDVVGKTLPHTVGKGRPVSGRDRTGRTDGRTEGSGGNRDPRGSPFRWYNNEVNGNSPKEVLLWVQGRHRQK